jgi:choline dehydrogenase-like flavoprotein
MAEIVIVGSGASGVNAAAPLVAAGHRVRLLDYGNEADSVAVPPPRPFSELRLTDEAQHRYFLGDSFEGIPLGEVRVGAQLTPARQHIAADVARRMPVDSATFAPLESLAVGGLAAGWGAGVFPFQDADLEDVPLTRAELDPHYEAVAERIGVAGGHDDLSPLYGDLQAMLPPPEIDSNAEAVLESYRRRRAALNRAGLYLGRTRLAMCTRAHRGRGPHPYHDMEFWTDTARSVYRPRWTLDELRRSPNFSYISRSYVESFAESGSGVEVHGRHADTGRPETHHARAVVLAAGTLSTARIVLRSLKRYGTRLPLVCNPYAYAVVLNLGMLGRPARDRRHSLAQISGIYRPPGSGHPAVHVHFYSYRSLLTFRLLNQVPLGVRDGIRALPGLIPILGILGLNHADRPTAGKHLALRPGDGGGPDRLAIDYRLSPDEERVHRRHERRALALYRRLGCVAVRVLRPGHGSSIHYAGTFPMTTADRELTCEPDGRLRGTRAVYLADGSGFASLPAQGLTLTMMANADRIGTLLARRLA